MDHVGIGRQGGRNKEDVGGDNRLDSQMESKEAPYRGTRTHRESRWDEPDGSKRGWQGNNDERSTPAMRFHAQEWADMPEDARAGGWREDFSNRRAETNAEDTEGWDRSGEKRRSFRDEEDKMMDRHRASKDREDMSEGRGRPGSKVQDDDDEYGDSNRLKDEFHWEEPDDRRRGWKSAKMGRGVKRSWSPNQKRRGKMDHDDIDKDWSDDRRDERGMRRDYDRDGDGHQDRKADLPWERDRDFQNRENLHEEGNFFRDRTREREDIERWKHRQNDRHKEKEDDLDYNYERDGWEVPRRDKGNAEKDPKSGENRREKDHIDVLKSPQSMLSDTMERAGAVSGDMARDRGLGHESPFMSRRMDSGEFYGNNGDANWMADERSRHGDSDYQDRPFLNEEGPPVMDHGFSRSSSRGGDSVVHFNVHNVRGRGPKGSPGQRGRASGDGRPPFANAKGMQQSGKSGRARGGGKTGRVGARENQRGGGIPPPVLGPGLGPGPGIVPHFGGHMGPPGSIPVMGSNMGPGSVPGMGLGGFPLPHFGGPVGWGTGRGAGDMGMHPGPPGPPPVHAPGPIPPRFGPNTGPGHGQQNIFYPPAGPGRGSSNVMPAPSFGGGRPEKASTNRIPPRVNAPAGMAPSRGEQNDYSQHFVDSGMRPQNFIRDVDLNDRFEEYPKLKELITRKDKLITENACPPMYMQMDLRTTELSPDIFGTKFDVILVDPPWEEYVRRAPGVGDSMEWWTFEEIQNLRIEAIADTPSFIFLWVGDAEGLDQGRLCLKKWGFRRCEDICWVKTNKENPSPALRHDASTLLQHSKEHCLMGIRGTVRRSSDAHIIHANIDTDIIISEEPPYGSTAKPEELYHIVEHFALGQRRLELFGEDHNIRAGWVTVGKQLTSSNFNAQTYCRYMGDAEGKVWQGGRGNPPIDAPHLVGTTPEIEALRPKSPPPRAQQPSASQPSAAHSNSKKAPNASSQGLSPQNAPVSSAGPGQVANSSSVIVINTTSPSHGHHHQSQGPSTVKGGNPKYMRRSPLHLETGGPLLLAGPEDERAMVGDGAHDTGSLDQQQRP